MKNRDDFDITNRHQGYLVWLLIGHIAFFAFSQGAVIWVYLSEVFRIQSEAKAKVLAVSRIGL